MWRELPQDKRAARTQIRARRRERMRQQSAQQRAADSAALAAGLHTLIAGLPAGEAAAYTSLATEPPTEGVVGLLERSGWRVMLPILLPDNDLGWRSGNPRDPSYVARATLLIVPALAIDPRGMRLGQGGGSYDRALGRRSPGALTLAVVYDDELAQVVPSDPHDLGVDAVLTPLGGVQHLTQ